MKKIIFIVSWLLVSNSLFGQFCEDFNKFTNTNVTIRRSCNSGLGALDNWGYDNMDSLGYSNSSSIGGTSDYYLRVDDGGCRYGSSYVHNNIDYRGNWIEMIPGEEGCFCFDIRLFSHTDGTPNGNTLILMDGDSYYTSTVTAMFVLNTPIDISRGWVTVCAPIELSDSSGNLPSNAEGKWTINTNSATDWDNLITNVRTVGFNIDIGKGNEVFGYDNICIDKGCNIVKGETDYCCDSDVNEIENGNFERRNNGFSSSYSVGTNSLYGVIPGQYYVGTNSEGLAISSLWNVNDHSACNIGSINDKVLFINGKTTQPTGTESVVYEQNLILGTANADMRYRFCANFKNMPQATFDIIPEIDIRVNGVSQTGGYVKLNNTIVSDPCSWELIDFDFPASGTVNIEIFLKEDDFGDGNDFAIDDISIQELQEPNYNITVQHQGNPQQITGSVFTIDSSDDELECESKDYCWYVVEVTNYSGSSLTYDINTFASGNDSGSSSFISGYMGCGTPWNLTTTYPCYPFDQDTLYLIGLYTPPNPDCCLDEGWTYQLTYNNKSSVGALSEDQKNEIRSMLECDNRDDESDEELSDIEPSSRLVVFPNPASNMLYIMNNKNKVKSYTINNMVGKTIKTKSLNNEVLESLDISILETGVYVLSIINEDGSVDKSKFIKK